MRAIIILGALFIAQSALPEEITDTIQMHELVEMPAKEKIPLREQNLSSISLSADDIRERGIYDIRDLTTIVPGLFISSTGSAQTTAVYLRGVGSRANTPAVGLYVDDMPWLEKSSFNSKIVEIERIEVLRGPQNTLFGRNSMGGLIRVTTKNPIDYQGTFIERSMANHCSHFTNITHYQRFSDKLGLTAGVAYRSGGQYFKNSYTGMKADADRSLRAHSRLLYRPSDVVNIDFLANYELCSQDAFPFYLESVSDDDPYREQLLPDIGRITSNDDNTYLRHLLNIGLKAERNWRKVTLDNILSFQYLNDDLEMDRDFTHLNIYTLQQLQRSRTLSEEIVVKNRPGAWRHWEWITGLGYHGQWMHSELKGNELYETPSKNAALYHQSTLCDVFNVKGLDLTMGLRLEYEHVGLTYSNQMEGRLSNDWWQLMPRFSLQHSFSKGNIYGTISRGYRSGGYNFHLLSDAMQSVGPSDLPSVDVSSLCLYRPEYTWNYEVGTHLNLVRGRLFLDASVFLTNFSDQQIAQATPSGLGLITVNAGRSRSYGGELALHSQITDRLQAHASYGYTHATFSEYMLSDDVSYKGNYVPFTPLHTVDVGANYTIPFPKIFDLQLLDRMTVSSNWHGLGKIYWTEDNLVSEPFHSTLDAKLSFYRKHLVFAVWVANIYDSRCRTFYFQSMNRGYCQRNKPFQFGFEMKLTFK